MTKKIVYALSLFTAVSVFIISCQKGNGPAHGHLQQTKTFSAEVAIKWMAMQVHQMRIIQPTSLAMWLFHATMPIAACRTGGYRKQL